MAAEYHFITNWKIQGTAHEVAEVLGDPIALTRWWPSVYLQVRELEPGDPQTHIGRYIELYTKGWLPYTIAWELEVVESSYPYGFAIAARGDFDGRGVWTFLQDGRFVNVTYDWQLTTGKPLLRNLSAVMRPVFEANHRWAMAQGEESLKLELARRRATSEAARAAIPPPPGPITFAAVGLIAGVAAVGAGLAYIIVRSRRRT